MKPLLIHKEHICLERTTTLKDTEDLHPWCDSTAQMSPVSVQGCVNTAGASACREVSRRFLHGFRVLNSHKTATATRLRKATRQFAPEKS